MTADALSRAARRLLLAVPADGASLLDVAAAAGLPPDAAPGAAVELFRAGMVACLAPFAVNDAGWRLRRELLEAAWLT